MAKYHLHVSDDYKSEVLECPHCGWSGHFDDGLLEPFDEVVTCSCPQCDADESFAILNCVVSLPDRGETE